MISYTSKLKSSTGGRCFCLKVLNGDFEETCSVSSDMTSVLFMLYNPVRDELITGGVSGAKVTRSFVWKVDCH